MCVCVRLYFRCSFPLQTVYISMCQLARSGSGLATALSLTYESPYLERRSLYWSGVWRHLNIAGQAYTEMTFTCISVRRREQSNIFILCAISIFIHIHTHTRLCILQHDNWPVITQSFILFRKLGHPYFQWNELLSSWHQVTRSRNNLFL